VTDIDDSGVARAQARPRAGGAGVSIPTVPADLRDHELSVGRLDLVVAAHFHLQDRERQGHVDRAAAAPRSARHLVVGHHRDSLGRARSPDPQRLTTAALLSARFLRLTGERPRRCERPSESGEEPLVDLVVWADRP